MRHRNLLHWLLLATCFGAACGGGATDGNTDGSTNGNTDGNTDATVIGDAIVVDSRANDANTADAAVDPVDAGPPDPCRSEGLNGVVALDVPTGPGRFFVDAAWGPSRDAPTVNPIGLVFDDAGAEVAAGVVLLSAGWSHATVGAMMLGAIPTARAIMGRRRFTTRDGLAATISEYRIESASTAAELRDAATTVLVGGSAIVPSAESWRNAAAYHLHVTTMNVGGDGYALIAIVPEDVIQQPEGAFRIRDFTNATGYTQSSSAATADCSTVTANEPALVDMLFTVDISGSMESRQERIAAAAPDFLALLDSAGVSYRIGLFEATHTTPNLQMPMVFQFISHTEPDRLTTFQHKLTNGQYPGPPIESPNLVPHGPALGDNSEQPVAAAVRLIETFEQNKTNGITAPNMILRDSAQVVAFFFTDESGTLNDDGRYFNNDTSRWGPSGNARILGATNFFSTRGIMAFGHVRDFGATCPTGPGAGDATTDFARCVVEGTDGGHLSLSPLAVDDTNEHARAGMIGLGEAIVHTTSQTTLPATPISATLRVTIGTVEVPRSRTDGYDYDAKTGALVFYGPTYRPTPGADIVVAYQVP